MNPKKLKNWLFSPSTLIGTGLIILSVIGWAVIPSAIELSRQARAGRLLEDYIQTNATEHADHFTCILPILTALPMNEGLAQAVDLLEQASARPPNNPYTDYLLGRAYCLQGDYQRAIGAFQAFNRQRPNNPLGRIEEGFANFSWALAMDETRLLEKDELIERSRLALIGAEVNQETLLDRGDEAYQRKNSQTAWLWYLVADAFGELPAETADRLAELEQTFQPVSQTRAPFVTGLALTETLLQQATSTPTPQPTPSLTPTPTIVPTATPGPGIKTPFGDRDYQLLIHEIQAQETLTAIANQYNTTVDVLWFINGLAFRIVQLGDHIVVCMGCAVLPDLPPLAPMYLEEGISLSDLAAEYITSIEDLRAWNDLGAGDWIEGGRWVVVRQAQTLEP
ncbi:MAG: LysM peptidoglycan-binding domain-containing protein [Brevefilum sp.]|nr:LysM peptidoglycan-binding domain-containing protein [Brevefilum sp.]